MHLLWRFEICLPSLHILIEFSPNDQNTPKLFVPFKRTNIYISSSKQIDNHGGSIEWIPIVMTMFIQFLIIFLRIFLVARYHAVCILTRVTRAPQSKRSKNLTSIRSTPVTLF
jgi:hypothetical protein